MPAMRVISAPLSGKAKEPMPVSSRNASPCQACMGIHSSRSLRPYFAAISSTFATISGV